MFEIPTTLRVDLSAHRKQNRITPQLNTRAATTRPILPCLSPAMLTPLVSSANVSHGSAEGATNYYHSLSKELRFSTPDNIFSTTLDDVANYLGYTGITGADLQNLPPAVLMNPDQLLAPCTTPGNCPNTLQNRDTVVASLGGIPF